MKSQQSTMMLALAIAAALLISGCSMTDRFKEDQGREFDATWPEVADATQREAGSLPVASGSARWILEVVLRDVAKELADRGETHRFGGVHEVRDA